MTLATKTTAASSYANVFYTKWDDSSAEVVLGKAAFVESTWSSGMGTTKPELWASTKSRV